MINCLPLNLIRFIAVLILIIAFPLYGQTTGKLSGRIIDQTSGKPMLGVNVLIESTAIGAATNKDGEFVMINVPPGNYNVIARMIGYKTVKVLNTNISVNRTTTMEIPMTESSVAMGEVVVSASKISQKKDQTGSIKNISSKQIKELPVENISEVVNMQAGIVRGHFRGGRIGETVTMIDGIEVNDAFRGSMVNIEKEVVQDLEVITGTFNAEYGNAMSGVVNMVTKNGGNKFVGSVRADFGNYFTSHNNIFPGLKATDVDRITDFRSYFSGPILENMLSFVINGRYQNNKGYLNYLRRFEPIDYNNYASPYPEEWHIEHSGDSAYIPAYDRSYTLFGKLTFKPTNSLRTSLTINAENYESMGYSHIWKYNPDGVAKNYNVSNSYIFQLNHTLSNSLFYLAQVTYLITNNRHSLFKDPLDPSYLSDGYARSGRTGFYTGGQDKSYSKTYTEKFMGKLSFTWQANKNHLFKTGGTYSKYNLDVLSSYIQNKYRANSELEGEISVDTVTNKVTFVNYSPQLAADSLLGIESYKHKPEEYSLYVQDKMEFDNLVINLGIRYDYYNANTVVPSNLRNPGNQLYFENASKMSTYVPSKGYSQLSPRLGLSYQLGNSALLHFAYGHFFQRPSFSVFYSNSSFLISPQDYGSIMGNPNLKPERSVSYEVGLWQELIQGMGLEVAVFYKDIYDLLTIIPIATYNQIRYGLYSNKDYGNVKGLEVKWDYFDGPFTVGLNYTLQYTKGVADNPYTNFSRAGSKLDAFNVLIPLSWDQRHTLNITAGYMVSKFGISTTVYFNSGFPYTWRPLPESRLSDINLRPNNAPMSNMFQVDMRAHYDVWEKDNMRFRINLLIYNLLDKLNEVSVYSSTGQAYTDIVRKSDLTEHHSDFNTYYDRIQNPQMYAAPRRIKLGLEFAF